MDRSTLGEALTYSQKAQVTTLVVNNSHGAAHQGLDGCPATLQPATTADINEVRGAGCASHYDNENDDDDEEYDDTSSGSDEVDLYLQTLQHHGVMSGWNGDSRAIYTCGNNAAPLVPMTERIHAGNAADTSVGGNPHEEMPAEGQASAGGDTGTMQARPWVAAAPGWLVADDMFDMFGNHGAEQQRSQGHGWGHTMEQDKDIEGSRAEGGIAVIKRPAGAEWLQQFSTEVDGLSGLLQEPVGGAACSHGGGHNQHTGNQAEDGEDDGHASTKPVATAEASSYPDEGLLLAERQLQLCRAASRSNGRRRRQTARKDTLQAAGVAGGCSFGGPLFQQFQAQLWQPVLPAVAAAGKAEARSTPIGSGKACPILDDACTGTPGSKRRRRIHSVAPGATGGSQAIIGSDSSISSEVPDSEPGAAEVVPKLCHLEDLRTLPTGGWGEPTPAAAELLSRLADVLGLDSPRVCPGVYTVCYKPRIRGRHSKWTVAHLCKEHPKIAAAVERWSIPSVMQLQLVDDPCHPVYNNDMVLRRTEPKQRMLVFTEDLEADTPLSAYFGTVKTLAESDEYVLADETHGRQLQESYTHTCNFTEHLDHDSERLVVVGDTRRCIMTYANEIRFWGSCEEMWRDTGPLAEDVRRTGCRCHKYKDREANTDCVQGIAKWQDADGTQRYNLVVLYFTKVAVKAGEEVLIHWDIEGNFFKVIREAVKSNRFYKRLQGRLQLRGQQRSEATARLAGAQREIAKLTGLLRLQEADMAKMRSELAALAAVAAPRLGCAASTSTAAQPAADMSYSSLLDELYDLRAEVARLRSERQVGEQAGAQVEAQKRQLTDLEHLLEEERADRAELEEQLAASRCNANLLRVQLDGCREEVRQLREQVEAAAVAGLAMPEARRVRRNVFVGGGGAAAAAAAGGTAAGGGADAGVDADHGLLGRRVPRRRLRRCDELQQGHATAAAPAPAPAPAGAARPRPPPRKDVAGTMMAAVDVVMEDSALQAGGSGGSRPTRPNGAGGTSGAGVIVRETELVEAEAGRAASKDRPRQWPADAAVAKGAAAAVAPAHATTAAAAGGMRLNSRDGTASGCASEEAGVDGGLMADVGGGPRRSRQWGGAPGGPSTKALGAGGATATAVAAGLAAPAGGGRKATCSGSGGGDGGGDQRTAASGGDGAVPGVVVGESGGGADTAPAPMAATSRFWRRQMVMKAAAEADVVDLTLDS